MKITIENLGPFDKLKLDFRDKGVVHLYGDSGTGKSSLFTVIMWILTGHPRNGIVNIKADKKKKIYGRLEYGDMTITRSKKPEKLEVMADKIFLEGEPASAYLESLYGPIKLILASCYLEQKSLHPLLSISAKDRLKLLQSLIDTTDKPEKYINIVDNRLKEITARREDLELEIKALKKELKKFKFEELENNTEDPDKLELERKELNEKLSELEKSLALFHQLSGSLSTIEQSLAKIDKESKVNESKVEERDLEKEITKCKDQKSIKEKEYALALQYKAELGIRKTIEA